MKNKILIFIVISLLFVVSGCKPKIVEKPLESTPKNSESNTPTIPIPSTTPVEQKYYAPYTGEEVSKEAMNNVAFMAMIENSPEARPQSGLTSADIVFEAMTEGGVTRFIALFQKDNSSKIGPIRSMRTYFMDIAYEYNLPFAHCGGSHDSLDRIKKEHSMSLDEMYNGSYYWRDTSIKIQEHSLYTSTEKLRGLVTEKGFIKEPIVKFKFDKSYWDDSSLAQGTKVTLKFNSTYTTAYDYKDGFYYKSMNNVATLNKEDKQPVAIKNIVIQNVNYKTRPKEEYLDANLIGQGDGYIISNGKMMKIKWSKGDLKAQTIFKDEKGNVVPLNVGKTWWHILDQDAHLTMN